MSPNYESCTIKKKFYTFLFHYKYDEIKIVVDLLYLCITKPKIGFVIHKYFFKLS